MMHPNDDRWNYSSSPEEIKDERDWIFAEYIRLGSTPTLPDEIQGEAEAIITLYVTILTNQMKLICSWYKSQYPAVDFPQRLPQTCNWNINEDSFNDIHFPFPKNGQLNYQKQRHIRCFKYQKNVSIVNGFRLRHLNGQNSSYICPACGNLDPEVWGGGRWGIYLAQLQHHSLECRACKIIIRGLAEAAKSKPLCGDVELYLYAHNDSSLKVTHSGATNHNMADIELFTEEGMYRTFHHQFLKLLTR